MDISNSQSINVKQTDNSQKSNVRLSSKSDAKFADELKNVKADKEKEEIKANNDVKQRNNNVEDKNKNKLKTNNEVESNDDKNLEKASKKDESQVKEALDGLNGVLDEIKNLNQKD